MEYGVLIVHKDGAKRTKLHEEIWHSRKEALAYILACNNWCKDTGNRMKLAMVTECEMTPTEVTGGMS